VIAFAAPACAELFPCRVICGDGVGIDSASYKAVVAVAVGS
jgi:hypothetical protein